MNLRIVRLQRHCAAEARVQAQVQPIGHTENMVKSVYGHFRTSGRLRCAVGGMRQPGGQIPVAGQHRRHRRNVAVYREG